MAIDTESNEATEPGPAATAHGGLCRLDLPGRPAEEDDVPGEDRAAE